MRHRYLFCVVLYLSVVLFLAAAGGPEGQTLTAALAAQTASPAPPPVIFKVETSYVDVDAIVTDKQGNIIPGLTKDDFELFEDGKPQKIDMFSYVNIPAVTQARFLAADRPISSDVKSNAPSLAGRLYVLVLDDLDTNPLRSQFVIKAARQFVEQNFAANDLAAIVYTSGRGDASQEFTGDRRLLLASIDKFVGRKLLSLTLAKADEFFNQHLMELQVNAASANDPENNGAPVQSGTVRGPIGYPDVTSDPDDFERGYRAQQVLDTLKSLSETLGGVRGRRKALLFFSEGIDYPIYDVFGSQAATNVLIATKDAIAAAARSNVSFFTIDPRGLVGMSAEEIELGASPDPSRGFDAHGLVAEMRLSQDSLRTLADETGGFAAVNSRNLTPVFERIVRTTSMYYVIGYYPPDHPRDGAFHKIEVRVKPPGLQVSARKGYASPRGKTREELAKEERDRQLRLGKTVASPQTSAELREVLNSPLQQSGLTLAVQAAPFKSKPKESTVALAIEVDGSRLHFEPRNNGTVFHDDVEVSFFALDDKGKPHQGNFYNLNLTLRPDTYERVRTVGLRLNPRVTLPPGRYQVRVGVRETGAGELGSVFYDLDVPDFTTGSLTMSGVLLTATSARLLLTPDPDTSIATNLLPAPATSRREFAQNDTLGLYAEVYDNLPPQQRHEIDITTTLLGENGREVFSSRQAVGGDVQTKSKSNTMGYTASVPLKDIQPGRYLLRVEAQARGSVNDVKPARETFVTVVAAK
jgi:VWFA-related protein